MSPKKLFLETGNRVDGNAGKKRQPVKTSGRF
jgi:hypothetical protein